MTIILKIHNNKIIISPIVNKNSLNAIDKSHLKYHKFFQIKLNNFYSLGNNILFEYYYKQI